MGRREHELEIKLKKEIENIGGITRKWVSPGHSGVPDQIVIHNGAVVFVEVKTLKGQLRPEQEREITRLKSHGVEVHVVKCDNDIDWLVDYIRRRYD